MTPTSSNSTPTSISNQQPPQPSTSPTTTTTLHIENLHIATITQLERLLASVDAIRINNTWVDPPKITAGADSGASQGCTGSNGLPSTTLGNPDVERSEQAMQQSEADVMLVAEKLRKP